MSKLSIEDVDVAGRRVLTRVDFNVPLDDSGRITDDRRIRAALPTIQSIITRRGKVVLMSHLGRPAENGFEAKYSLEPAAEALSRMLGQPVGFPSQDCVDAAAAAAVESLGEGQVLLLENLRFHAGETENDAAFAAELAKYGQVYCNDAFGTAHRAHASIVAVPRAMGGARRAAGLLLLAEVKYLGDILDNPQRPFVAVLGGAKVSDKLGAIRRLLDVVDDVLVGGAMAYTFLEVLGRRMGKSRVEHDRLDDAKEIIELAAEKKADLFFPNDHVCGKEISDGTPIQVFEDHIEDGWIGLDIGPQTQHRYAERISKARTIIWNGPMGVFEVGPFSVGTKAIADAMAAATSKGATTVIGGGDSAAAVEALGMDDEFSHVSTGGGASLRLLEGRDMPGLDALDDA
ncbi:MAG: phosphoglycerate kinase [Phycisphaerales bacterium]|nr:phosphoglycerate kinase [Phycisphaerales bacterium]